MLHQSPALRKAAALAALVCGLSSATAQANETPPAGISCSGVLTFLSGPQTSLQCSSDLVLQHGLLEAADSITISAADSILIGQNMVLKALNISVTSPKIVVDGFLEGGLGGEIVLTSPDLSGDHIVNGAISTNIITVGNPTLAVPEASTTAMVILGLLTCLAWKNQRRILPVKTCQNITQSPIRL